MYKRLAAICFWIAVGTGAAPAAAQPASPTNPPDWGSDHVGRPVPPFTSGDECLFCHRTDIGPTWNSNRHGQTVRDAGASEPALMALSASPKTKDLALQVELLLGRDRQLRFLKRSSEQGRLDMLTHAWTPSQRGTEGTLSGRGAGEWDGTIFGDRCMGCHATGADSQKRTFASLSLDCYVCHGEVPDRHTTQGGLVHLSPHGRDSPRVVTSICAQCHLRTGVSASTGLPFPNNFVAGDNLFRDFRVNLSDEKLRELNPADRHIQENVRDVVVLGREETTCLSCHDIHKQSSARHHAVPASKLCQNCHGTGPKKERIQYSVHSERCGY